MAGIAIPRSTTVAATRSSRVTSSGESGWPSGSTAKACRTRAVSPLSRCARNPLENSAIATRRRGPRKPAHYREGAERESIRASGLLFGVVGTTHQGTGLHMAEAQRQPFRLEPPELLRRVEAHDRPVGLRRLQVLSNRED